MTARRRFPILAAALLGALAATGCTREPAPAPAADATPPADAAPPAATPPEPAPATPSATARIAGANDNPATGEVTVVTMGDGVHLNGTIAGLAPDSEHGFHLHETGDCSDPAGGSAGKHFNPTAQSHGGPDATARHGGDMPNLHADASGNATVDVHVAGAGLGTRDAIDVVGRAIVIHDKADDYATQPSGNSGTPIACGVIELPEAAAPAPSP